MVVLSSGWSLITVLALAAADRYTFRRLLIANALLTLAGILLARGRLRLGGRTLSYTSLLPLALAIFCAWRFTPAAEYVMGGKDPGTYVNEGIQIAQRGSILIADQSSLRCRRSRATCSFRVIGAGAAADRLLRHPLHGFPLRDPDAGHGRRTVSASVSRVDCDRLRRRRAQRRAPGHAVLGNLGCWRSTSPVSRLFGRPRPSRPPRLLALNVVTVWFARYPNAEVVMQAFLFAALLANARAHVDGDRFFAPVAGVLLGLLLFLRFDAVLGVGRSRCGSSARHLRGAAAPILDACRIHRSGNPGAALLPRAVARICESAARVPCGVAVVAIDRPRDRRSVRNCRPLAWAVETVDQVHGRALRPVCDCARPVHPGYLRSVLQASGRPPGRPRCLLASHLCELLRHGAGGAGRAPRVSAVRARGLLARPGALRDSGDLYRLRVLQDPDRPGTLLGGATFSSGHPAGHPAFRVRGRPRQHRRRPWPGWCAPHSGSFSCRCSAGTTCGRALPSRPMSSTRG